MLPKESVLYSVVFEKCPRCHEGDLFVHKNPYYKLQFRKMHNNCNACGQPSEPEPGFYQGAMYASYAVSVAICFVLGGILLFTNLSAEAILISLIVVLVILLPWIFRVSRMLWLNLFIKYRPDLSKSK